MVCLNVNVAEKNMMEVMDLEDFVVIIVDVVLIQKNNVYIQLKNNFNYEDLVKNLKIMVGNVSLVRKYL